MAGLSLGAGVFFWNETNRASAAETLPGLERCYDQPRTNTTMNSIPPAPPKNSYAYPSWERTWAQQYRIENQQNIANHKPLKLLATKQGIIGDPRDLSPSTDKKVENSLVEVVAGDRAGSGELVEDYKGREVVITAAHVPRHMPMNLIKVHDGNNKSSQVLGGCYMFESDGKIYDPAVKQSVVINGKKRKEFISPDIDIAVLILSHKIGSGVLKLAAEQPGRGDWVFFKNYQNQAPMGEPYTYGGVVVQDFDWPATYTVLSGLQYWRKTENSIRGGASGGPVVNRFGELVGASVGGPWSPDNQPESKAWLEDYYAVSIDGLKASPKTGLIPRAAEVMPLEVLRLALASRRA